MFFHEFLALGEAALAADWITAWKTLQGGCASNRLHHGRTGGGADILILFWLLARPKVTKESLDPVGH